MSIFDIFKTSNNNKLQTKSDVDIQITFDGKDYVDGMKCMPKNLDFEARIKEHNKRLIAIYEKQSRIYSYDQDITARLIKRLTPNANKNTCPYCGVIHPFSAIRARKCPACGKKMVVRNGVYLRENDIAKLESLSQLYYDKTQAVESLKYILQNIQDNKHNCNYGSCFLYIAEAYDSCALIQNQIYRGGFTNWDYAWSVLNKDALDSVAAVSRSKRDLVNNGYSEILFARGMHLLRELKHSTNDRSRAKYAKIAIATFIEYLFELSRLQLSDWNEEEAPKLVHVALKLGRLNIDWIDEAAVQLVSRSTGTSDNNYMIRVTNILKDYVLIESDPEQLGRLIY